MEQKEKKLISVSIIAITLLFFYKIFFGGFVPFPGDILMSEYQPWRSTSYLGYTPGGIPNKAQYPDVIRQIYPWKTLVVDALKKGNMPLWNPYNFSGTPLLANFQSAALYPLGIFYLLLNQIDAWTLLVILQPILAGLFTYFYCRKVGLTPLGSAMSAASYGFSGFITVWLQYNTIGHVILWLPLVLLSIEHQREKLSKTWLIILILTNTFSLLAGHPQVYAYSLLFSIVYSLFRTPKKIWIYIFGGSLLGIGLSGIAIIPGLELILYSARSTHDPVNLFEKILIQPWQMLSLGFPNIFGNPATRSYWPSDTFIGKVTTIGLVPLFFLFSAIRRKDALTKFYLYASVGILLLITANPITYLLYRNTTSSPTLMSFLFAFCLSIFCGLGLDYWTLEKHSVHKLFKRTIQTAALFALLFFVAKISPYLSIRALLYGLIITTTTLSLFWVFIQLPKYKNIALMLFFCVHLFDLFYFFHKFNPFVPKEFVFPQHEIIQNLKQYNLDRFWGYGSARLEANFATEYGIYSPEGYDPLYPKWYGEFLYMYKNGNIQEVFTNSTRSDAAIESTYGDEGVSDMHKKKILDALSVGYILDRTENTHNANIPNDYPLLYSQQDWKIHKNPNAAPRAYLAQHIFSYDSNDEFSKIFYSESFNPTTSLLVPNTTSSSNPGGTAQIITYAPEKIVIETQSTTSSTLVLTDTYYPGWVASVDTVPTEIVKANWTMRAIPITAGNHTVMIEYKPTSVTIGVWLSIISSIVLLCISIFL